MLEQLADSISEKVNGDGPWLHCPTTDPECTRCLNARLMSDKAAFIGSGGAVFCGVAGALAFAASAGIGGVWAPFFVLWAWLIGASSASAAVVALVMFGHARLQRGRQGLTCEFDRLNRRIGLAKSSLYLHVVALSTMGLSAAMVPQ